MFFLFFTHLLIQITVITFIYQYSLQVLHFIQIKEYLQNWLFFMLPPLTPNVHM